MVSDIETFLNRLDEIITGEPEYHLITAEDERPPIWSIIYKDFPTEGYITAFTYGLSSVDYPEWREGRPELIISVESRNSDWGMAIGYVAQKMRGKHSFSYGSIIDFGERITNDSAMSGFLIFAPTILPMEVLTIKLRDRTVNFVQLYPIYEDEFSFLQNTNTTDFFLRKDLDLFDINRSVVKNR